MVKVLSVHAIVSTFFDSIGGISSYVKNVLIYSKLAGVDYILISPDLKNKCSDDGKFAANSTFKLLVILKMIRMLYKKDVRYIQCHGVWYLALACCLYKYFRRAFGTTVMVSVVKHSDIKIDPKSIKKTVLEFIDNSSDAVIFVSRYLENKYTKVFGFIFHKPVYVVNPGCSTVDYDVNEMERLRGMLGAANKKPLLTYIGLFEYMGKVNGLLLLLEAVRRLKSRYTDVHLAIAGRGSHKNKIVQAISSLGLRDNVSIFEDIDNPYNLLMLSELHCHITCQDNIPLVVLEALNAKIPVVASETGELPNIGIEGLTITKLDIDSIVSSIIEAISNPTVVDVRNLREKYNWKISADLLNRITESPT